MVFMKILFFLTLTLFCCQLQAQQFGLKAGMSYNTMNFQAGGTPSSIKSRWQPGFSLGGLLNVPLYTDAIISLQPEYAYKLMKGDDIVFNTKFTLHYLSLPVLLRLELGERIALLAGPEFGLLIHAQEHTRTGASIDTRHDIEERAVSAVGGVELRMASSLFVEARYVHGYNHVGLGQRTALREFKWRGVEAGIGWRF